MPPHRPRLRVRNSCQCCKQRRKKCDGKRPLCGPCIRRGYLCSWTNTTVSRLLETCPVTTIPHSIPDQQCTSGVALTHLSSDFQSPTSVDVLPSLSRVDSKIYPAFEATFDAVNLEREYSPNLIPLASTTDFGNSFDEHIIISAVLYGWNYVRSLFLLDAQWSYIVHCDRELVKIGNSTAHRLAALWFCRMKMKVMAAVSFGLHNNVPLPKWAVADVHHQMHANLLVNYIPWPSIRRVVMASPERFCDPKWSHAHAKYGIRFVWPAEPCTAYTTTTTACGSMRRFTPEFMLRMTNLRSWALTNAFLDQNPDLRGLAPQLEPSATLLRVSSRPDLERLYWQMLRRKYAPLLKGKG